MFFEILAPAKPSGFPGRSAGADRRCCGSCRGGKYADEFLIHAVDVEGKSSGVDGEILDILSRFDECPVTYAGGVGSYEDLRLIKDIGNDKIDVTIGSALDLFGGYLSFEEICRMTR